MAYWNTMGPTATTALALAAMVAGGCLKIPAAPGGSADASADAGDAGGGSSLGGVNVFVLEQPTQNTCLYELGNPLPENCKVIVNGPHYTVEFEYGTGRPKLPKLVSVPPSAVNLLGIVAAFPSESAIGVAFYSPPGDRPVSASTNAYVPDSDATLAFNSYVQIDAFGPAAVTVTSTWETTDPTMCGADVSIPSGGVTARVITAFTFYPDGRIVKADQVTPVELGPGCEYLTTYVTLAGPPMPEVAWNIVGGPSATEQYDMLTTLPGGYAAAGGYDGCLYNPADASGPEVMVYARPDTPYQGARIHNFPNPASGTIGFVHDWRRASNQPGNLVAPLLATTVLWVGSHTDACTGLNDAQVVGLSPSGWEFLPQLGLYHALAGAETYTMQPGLPTHSALQFDLVAADIEVRLGGTLLAPGVDYLVQRANSLWTLYFDRSIDLDLTIGPAA